MKVRVFPQNGIILDLPAEVALNLLKQGQAELVEKLPAAVIEITREKKPRRRKSKKNAPENKALTGYEDKNEA